MRDRRSRRGSVFVWRLRAAGGGTDGSVRGSIVSAFDDARGVSFASESSEDPRPGRARVAALPGALGGVESLRPRPQARREEGVEANGDAHPTVDADVRDGIERAAEEGYAIARAHGGDGAQRALRGVDRAARGRLVFRFGRGWNV